MATRPRTEPATWCATTFGSRVKTVSDKGSGVSYDHNLNSGKSGTGNINGTPVFLASPSSGYYHYQLAPSSPGYQAASDGKSLGIAP